MDHRGRPPPAWNRRRRRSRGGGENSGGRHAHDLARRGRRQSHAEGGSGRPTPGDDGVTLSLARDPSFPHRDALLDPAFVAACLARRFDWATRVTRLERVRATYRIGRSLRMLHRFEASGAEYHVAARAFRPGQSARAFAKAVAAADTSHAEAAGVVHGADVDAVFWLFPNDRRVATLRTIEAARAILSPRLPRPWVASRLAAWAPENSATFQCLDAAGAVMAYAKVG